MGTWEQRWHPLRREWVIVAAHRQNRPWSGRQHAQTVQAVPKYDPGCYLCPGNVRVSAQRNPDYTGVFVFDNDLPCVGPDAPAPADLSAGVDPGLYRATRAEGIARVVCYTPRHDLSLARLEVPGVDALLAALQGQYRELSRVSSVRHVLMFENCGSVVGVSNPHPHGQIYATNFVFKTIENEAAYCRAYWEQTGRSMLEAINEAEIADGRRVVCGNTHALAYVPYFARYAYEVYVCPRRAVWSVADLTGAERMGLAQVLREVLIRFDNLWEMPFPYVMAFHQAPCQGEEPLGFGFHIEFHPPLRKPDLLKYLAGPEIGGGSFLSDTCPEEKAAELRAVSGVHYLAGAS